MPHEAPQKSAWSSASWNRTPISREIKSLFNDISTYHFYSVLNKSKPSDAVMDSPPESPLSDRKVGRLFSEQVGWHRNVLEDETCDILQRRIRPIVFSKSDSIRVSVSDVFCRFLHTACNKPQESGLSRRSTPIKFSWQMRHTTLSR